MSACSAWTGDMCLHVVLGSMYIQGTACSACCIRCVGHILIELEYRLVATECVHNTCVCVCVSACGVSVCVSACVCV